MVNKLGVASGDLAEAPVVTFCSMMTPLMGDLTSMNGDRLLTFGFNNLICV